MKTLILATGFALMSCADTAQRTAPVGAPTKTEPAAPVVEAEPATLAELLRAIEAAYRKGNYERGLALVQRAFELKQNDVSALDRIGSIYYVLGRYGEALTIWKRALPLEHDLKKRAALENSIAVTRRSLGIAEEVAAIAPIVKTRPPKPVKRPARKSPQAEIERLYKLGVKNYTAGEYLQATTAFLRILEFDPDNADARKALERLKLAP